MYPFFKSHAFKRIVIFAVIIGIVYILRDMMNLILLTFIFTFLMNKLTQLTTKALRRVVPIRENAVAITFYLLLVAGITLVVVNYLPMVTRQITQLVEMLTGDKRVPQDNSAINFITSTFEKFQLNKYVDQGINILLANISGIGKAGVQVFMAFILSLFILLEKGRIIRFTSKFQTSKIGPMYNEIAYFCKKFIRSFGKVIEAQFAIATINCILSVIVLWVMGFPQLIALGIMIFVLGLIPVAGVIISLIPLTVIGYSLGGLMYIFYILLFVVVLHALETYFLNPKLMSAKTDLPIFYTFAVLIFAEHFIGIWGLIIGIPIFMFFLDVLEVTSHDEPVDS